MAHNVVYGICENFCKVVVYAKSQMDEILEGISTALNDRYTKSEVNTALNDRYTKNETYSRTELYKKTEVENRLSSVNDTINEKTGTITSTKYIGTINISSGSTSRVISDSGINANSLIDIYYANTSVETVRNAKPSYSQTNGSLTITFASALSSSITIDKIRVVNV